MLASVTLSSWHQLCLIVPRNRHGRIVSSRVFVVNWRGVQVAPTAFLIGQAEAPWRRVFLDLQPEGVTERTLANMAYGAVLVSTEVLSL